MLAVADLHMAQLMPLSLTVSCFSKIQIGFTFLLPAYLVSPRKRAVKWVCVCVCVPHLVQQTDSLILCLILRVLLCFVSASKDMLQVHAVAG